MNTPDEKHGTGEIPTLIGYAKDLAEALDFMGLKTVATQLRGVIQEQEAKEAEVPGFDSDESRKAYTERLEAFIRKAFLWLEADGPADSGDTYDIGYCEGRMAASREFYAKVAEHFPSLVVTAEGLAEAGQLNAADLPHSTGLQQTEEDRADPGQGRR